VMILLVIEFLWLFVILIVRMYLQLAAGFGAEFPFHRHKHGLHTESGPVSASFLPVLGPP